MNLWLNANEDGYVIVYDISDLEKFKKVLMHRVEEDIDVHHFGHYDYQAQYELDFKEEDIDKLPESMQRKAKRKVEERKKFLAAPDKRKKAIFIIQKRVEAANKEEGLRDIWYDIEEKYDIPNHLRDQFTKIEEIEE